MEIVIFLAMMIVPFISIAALVIAMLAKKQSQNVKDYLVRHYKAKNPNALDELTMSEL